MSDHFIAYLNKLPPKERTFFLLMSEYARTMTSNHGYITNKENYDIFINLMAECYETQINRLLIQKISSSVYESQPPRNEQAEKSQEDTKDDRMKMVKLADSAFDEKLGKWAPSSSEEEKNKSDLSSEEN